MTDVAEVVCDNNLTNCDEQMNLVFQPPTDTGGHEILEVCAMIQCQNRPNRGVKEPYKRSNRDPKEEGDRPKDERRHVLKEAALLWLGSTQSKRRSTSGTAPAIAHLESSIPRSHAPDSP